MGDPDSNLQSGADDSSSASRKTGLTVEECQDMIETSFRNPLVRILKAGLEKSGCHIGRKFVRAVRCYPTTVVNGFFSKSLGIYICSNCMEFQEDVTKTVIHELIHAYDECRAANMEWSNCAHRACSEIRATHLSGDCSFKKELFRGILKIKGHEPDCVRRTAIKSMTTYKDFSEAAAKDAMEAVWDICYNDTSPFDRAP